MDDDLRARIELLEQHVDWLYANAGLQGPYGTQYAQPAAPPAPAEPAQEPWRYPVSPAVLEIARAGRVIDAIRLQRQEIGQGLGEAKAAVDAARAMR